MIKDSSVIKASAAVSEEDSRQISSILNYFERNNSLKDVKSLPQGFKTSDMESVLGVKYTEEYNMGSNGYFNFNSLGAIKPIDIKEYDYFFDSRNNGQQGTSSTAFSIGYDYESSILKITKDGKDIYKRDLQDFANILMDKYGSSREQKGISSEEMSFVDENGKVKIKIQFSNISGNKNTSSGKIESNSLEFYVLVKIK